jgi:Arc/MetJ-type ribon-helix-helix transcriptional regulator|tara:strand:+ start:824 stop:961 length:138 start_codon:yes stop_codon:yes gene_type:complete
MKKPISATLDEDLVEWLDKKISDKKKYRNRSHLIEIALEEMRRKG